MAASRPRVFTIPPSVPFIPTLIEALAAGRLIDGFPGSADPLALASATIYLPTRRACRLARDLFLDTLGRDAAVLPRLIAIGDVDEDELVFAETPSGPLAPRGLDVPPALGGMERKLLLAQMILRWASSPDVRTAGQTPLVANTPAAALALADALARLMDDMTTRKVSWDRLNQLVPDHLDKYWDLTLKFLRIARDAWPAMLAEHGVIEPAARRDLLIEAEAARLMHADGPVIAAGSTASMPATAALLATIARLPQGAVVLPGLDMQLDAASWDMIGGVDAGASGRGEAPSAGHPQFAMHGFLARVGMLREEVEPLAAAAPHGRERLISEAMRPAETSERWSENAADVSALSDIALIEAANPEEEAFAIAVALREALEADDATAALVTPDRALARRVIAALGRWNVTVDDSGGDALSDTPAGVFARLAAQTALDETPPVTLLALLKHPLLRLGAPAGAHQYAIATLERGLLRGPRPKPGTAGLAHALETFRHAQAHLHGSDPRRHLAAAGLDAAADLVARLRNALVPLEDVGRTQRGVADLATRHRAVFDALTDDGTDDPNVSETLDVATLRTVLDEIALSEAGNSFGIDPAEYGEFFRDVGAAHVVRRPVFSEARVRVFGLLEFRLQHFDRVVLGGLVEGTWPPQTRSDPWLSRPMRHDLGLDLPERRIGLTAHDFTQALGARELVLSRAAKIAGAPTVASRFVQRLRAVAGEAAWAAARQRGDRYLAYARRLDHPETVQAVRPPTPTPPRAARPTRLSVTQIEHWLRDPYTIYARHILRLMPLDAVDTAPGARDRGILIHGAIGDFTAAFRDALPSDPVAELLKFGRERFAPLSDYPEARAFWWPRFERIARWFATWERERRAGAAEIFAEIDGALEIAAGDRVFKLTTRADRIERYADGSYAVLDYKSGTPPSDTQVRIGVGPQLSLEAAILRHGLVKGVVPGASVRDLIYVAVRGVEPPGAERVVNLKGPSVDEHADRALAALRNLVVRFEDETEPYRSLVRPMWKNAYGDYDHLARIKEWSLIGGEIDPDIP